MKFTLTDPCKKCPFRTDIEPFLREQRAWEIGDGLLAGHTFTCHETTVEADDDGDEESSMEDGPNAQHCAGAMIILEKICQPSQMMRICGRIGQYDRTKLNMKAPVFEGMDEFAEAQET